MRTWTRWPLVLRPRARGWVPTTGSNQKRLDAVIVEVDTATVARSSLRRRAVEDTLDQERRPSA